MLFIITYASFLLPGTCDNSSEIGTHELKFFWTSAFTIFSHPLLLKRGRISGWRAVQDLMYLHFFRNALQNSGIDENRPSIYSNIFISLCRWFIWTNNYNVFFNHKMLTIMSCIILIMIITMYYLSPLTLFLGPDTGIL